MAETDLIRRSEVVEAIDNIDWYHQNANKDMVRGASNEHEAWYKAEDIYRALESVTSAQPSDDYEIGWEDGRKALREEIWEDGRDRAKGEVDRIFRKWLR